MKLMHPLFSKPILFQESCVTVLVAENPVIFRQWIFDLSAQIQGMDGRFVLSQDNQPLACPQHLFLISDYYHLPADDKALQSRFLVNLTHTVQQDLSAEMDSLNQSIATFLQQVSLCSDYPVSYSDCDYSLFLLKWLKYQAALDADNALEQLLQYCELVFGLFPNICVALVSPHSYFSPKELQHLYQTALHKKWVLLLLESHTSDPLPYEAVYLIDNNLCELRLD